MSLSNRIIPFDSLQLSTVHQPINSGNVGLGAGQTIMVYDNQGNTYLQNTNIQVNAGNARDVSIKTTIRNTYPARYNFAVKQYNSLPDQGVPGKKQMRGGRFFMYRWVIILVFLIALIAGGISAKFKPFIAVDIILALIYIILSIYNMIIFKRNGSLISSRMIHDNGLTACNDYYQIPINTAISQSNVVASAHEDIIAGLRNTYNHLTEIQVMVYNEYYIRTYTFLPRKNIIKHIISFLFAMILGLVLTIIVKNS